MRAAPVPVELRRPLGIATALAWIAVTAPVPLQMGGTRGAVVAGWAALAIGFAGCALGALRAASRGARVGLLAGAAGAVLGTVLLACDGLEGALLVLVAAQVGGLVSRRAGIAWVAAQSALLVAAIAWHWSLRPALLLGPAYAGFQLLALLLAGAVATASAARRDLAAAQAALAEHARLGERLRIARELHDAVGHKLTALGMQLEVTARTAPPAVAADVAAARALARECLSDVRDVVERLRDDERVDVAGALRAMCGAAIAPRVHLSAPEGVCREEPALALAVLRCAQEIVTNARRHARADNLWLAIGVAGGRLELTARDDGVGAALLRDGNGLRGMRERVEAAGGALTIATAAGRGFEVRAVFPGARA